MKKAQIGFVYTEHKTKGNRSYEVTTEIIGILYKIGDATNFFDSTWKNNDDIVIKHLEKFYQIMTRNAYSDRVGVRVISEKEFIEKFKKK